MSRWYDWMVVERMVPTGERTDANGKRWAEFEMEYRLRWWRYLHPGFWYAVVRGRKL